MMVSFHVVEFDKRLFAPPRRLAETIPGLRFWRPLNVGGDFAWYRAHPTRRALYPRLRPDFRRWAFFAVWEDEARLDEFLERSAVSRFWCDHAREAWHLWMRPLRVRGPWPGMQLLVEGTGADAVAGRPIVHIVRLDLSFRGTLAMWGSAAPHVLAHLPDQNELLVGIPLVDRPYTQPVSFSLWRSTDSAAAFAYYGAGHRDAIARVKSAQRDVVDRHSSGRFLPYRSEGTWHGRNPLYGTLPAGVPSPEADGRAADVESPDDRPVSTPSAGSGD